MSSIPSSRARPFIRRTKEAVPPQWSARAAAASLPEHSSSPYSSSSTVTRSPGFKYMEEPSVMCSCRTVTSSPGDARSSTTRAVMILVVLAMSIRRLPLWSYSTCPVSASISTAAEALVDTPHARTGVRHHHSASPTRSHIRFLTEITPYPQR